DSLRGLTPSTAKDQISQSLRSIADDLSSIANARKDLASARRDEVQAANDKFAQSVKDTLGGVTSLATLQAGATGIKQTAQQRGDGRGAHLQGHIGKDGRRRGGGARGQLGGRLERGGGGEGGVGRPEPASALDGACELARPGVADQHGRDRLARAQLLGQRPD